MTLISIPISTLISRYLLSFLIGLTTVVNAQILAQESENLVLPPLHTDNSNIIEYHLDWPTGRGGTHEIIFNPNEKKEFWVSGPEHDAIAKVTENGKAKFYPMPTGSSPHGLAFDYKGRLWVALEGTGFVVRVNKHGEIVESINVHNRSKNPGPHGLGTSNKGEIIWFTGKAGNTIGRITLKDRKINQFLLPTPNAQPIYISEGGDGNMWCTELTGNTIARITPKGRIQEFPIPTPNSRPIVILPAPNNQSMWFSEETSHKVARISFQGDIVEYQVPKTQNTQLLAGIAFDNKGNLWAESYIDPSQPLPHSRDYIIKIDKAILHAKQGNISSVPFKYYQVPTIHSVLHRIIQGPDENMWFTELAADNLGTLLLK